MYFILWIGFLSIFGLLVLTIYLGRKSARKREAALRNVPDNTMLILDQLDRMEEKIDALSAQIIGTPRSEFNKAMQMVQQNDKDRFPR